MKEYECEEYRVMIKKINDYLFVVNSTIDLEFLHNSVYDILDIVKENSNLINEKLREDNEKLTLKMIEIENATKGYLKNIEEVMK